MKRLSSRKSHSWWWDSHISPKNSKWLSENLEQMDRLVKEMLKLIEEEGDSSAKKAEMYYRRRPELISHVEDFYRMYRALAERYDIVTGELRKNIPSDLQSQGSGNCSDFGAEPGSPSSTFSPDRTPEHKQNLPKPSRRAAGFNVFLGSTTSSDFSRKGSDDSSSSSSSESGSDSEDGNARITQLENELREAREMLKECERSSNGQCFHSASIGEHRDQKDKIALEDVDLQADSGDKTVALLETEICSHRDEIKSLKEAMEASAKQFETEISLKDHTIEEYKAQLDAAMNKFIQEKSALEADLKLEAKQLSEEKSSLEIRILELEQMIKELEVMLAESSERFFHEKSALESKVRGLLNSENALASKLQALSVVEVEADDVGEVLEADISNHKAEIQRLKEAMKAAAKQFEFELSLKDHTIEEYKIQLKSSMADLILEAEQLSEKKLSLEIRILVQEQLIKESKVMSAESKVCGLMNFTNIHASKHSELKHKMVVLEAEILNHKSEIKRLNESMESAAKQFEAEISAKDHTIEECKAQLDAAMNKFTHEKSTLEAELKSNMADLKLESEQLEIKISKQEQMIKELKLLSKESSERLLHEKTILESRVSSLMDSENIRTSKLQAFEDRLRELEVEKAEACNVCEKRIDELKHAMCAKNGSTN